MNIFFRDYLFLKLAFFFFTVVLLFQQFWEFLIEKPTYTSISKAPLGKQQILNIEALRYIFSHEVPLGLVFLPL